MPMSREELDRQIAETHDWVREMDSQSGGPLMERRGIEGVIATASLSLVIGVKNSDQSATLIALALLQLLEKHFGITDGSLSVLDGSK